MAVIKSSKIFISIRHPHATCIINAQPKDTTTTFTAHTFPSADRLYAPRPADACVQMKMDEQHSTGRSGVSQTAFWAVIVPPTQQMCRAAPSPLSLGAFLLWKHHSEVLLAQPPLRADALPPQSHSDAPRLPWADGGAARKGPHHNNLDCRRVRAPLDVLSPPKFS